MAKNVDRDYNFSDGKVYCLNNGKLIAEIDASGVVIYAPGMIGPHKASLEAWLTRNGLAFKSTTVPPEPEVHPPEPEVEAEKTSNQPPSAPEVDKNHQIFSIDDIPDELLPKFDKMLGRSTPELKAFITFYRLTPEQTTALIRKLENR